MKHLLLTTIAAVLLVGCGGSIHDAAHTGNIEAVKKHLASGADLNTKDSEGGTPLHHAAWNGHKEVAELLIEKGANVNAKSDVDETPLDWAKMVTTSIRIKSVSDKISADKMKKWKLLQKQRDDSKKETADLLRKHGGKTGEELKAEGK